MKALVILFAALMLIAAMSGQLKSGSAGNNASTASGAKPAPKSCGLQSIPTGNCTVEMKREIVSELRRFEQTLPQKGQQMGTSSCGQPVYCSNDPRAEVREEIARIEREIVADLNARR